MNRRVIANVIFPGDPIAYKRVEWRGSRARNPEIVVAWQDKLRKMLGQALPDLRPSSAHFGVQQVFHLAPQPSTVMLPDGDNLQKLLWDAFNKRIWYDDGQILEWTGKKELNSADPHTHLIAYVLEP